MSLALDDRSESLREEVSEQEERLRLAVRDLEDAARRTFELRHHFGSHPVLWTAGVFALGLWLGGRKDRR